MGLSIGPFGDPGGVRFSYERGTPVGLPADRGAARAATFLSLSSRSLSLSLYIYIYIFLSLSISLSLYLSISALSLLSLSGSLSLWLSLVQRDLRSNILARTGQVCLPPSQVSFPGSPGKLIP